MKRFTLRGAPRAEFEGIPVAGGEIHMAAGNGMLFQFREGPEGARLSFTTHDPRLGRECEFEGVAFERDRGTLLLRARSCTTNARRELVMYRWRIGEKENDRISRPS